MVTCLACRSHFKRNDNLGETCQLLNFKLVNSNLFKEISLQNAWISPLVMPQVNYPIFNQVRGYLIKQNEYQHLIFVCFVLFVCFWW